MIFDVEGDSLVPTRLHVLSYWKDDKPVSLTSYDAMRKWLLEQKVLICHNCIRFDIPTLERILDIKIKAELVDTLALSWYLYDRDEKGGKRRKHGLESWGEYFGVPKPEIDDWENLPIEEYVHRCEEDVKINKLLWDKQSAYLCRLYNTNDPVNLPIVKYLSFKLDCAREQERSKWRLDKEKCLANLEKLEAIKSEKEEAVKKLMPPIKKYDKKPYPKKPYKKDGTLSTTGARWQLWLRELGLGVYHKDDIEVFSHFEEPNPNSPDQIKEWLFSLGWEPETFKYVKDDKGGLRPIPQIKKLMDPELCDSVKRLIEQYPEIEPLEGLSIVSSRVGNLKAFLENEKEGFVQAQIGGLTNTLRFSHINPCVNLPGKDRLYGKEVRECLVAREGYELCGSDQTALEDLTKRHYMYPYDPDYVNEMSKPGFDPHLDLALHSGALTEEQVQAHKDKKEDFGRVRQDYKKTNYSATYGIGKDKLARELKSTVAKAALLIKDFWKRNWAIKKIAENAMVKSIDGQKWIFNPVSNFWYSLRNDKDRFSTLNQSTGVFCFDTWIWFLRQKRPQLTAQFHDEIIIEVKKGYQQEVRELLLDCMKKTNDKLQLNVQLSIDIKFGDNYAQIH